VGGVCLRGTGVIDGGGHMDLQALHVLGQDDLAAQARGVRQFVCQIQHVQLLITGFVWQFLEIAGLEDQVAGGAGKCAFAGAKAIQIHTVIDHHVQQRVAHFSRRLNLVPVGTHEGYVNTANRDWSMFMLVARCGMAIVHGSCGWGYSHIFRFQGQSRRESARCDRGSQVEAAEGQSGGSSASVYD